jgi:hypothetical protein
MIPFGWQQTDPDSKILQPVDKELVLLEQAVTYWSNGRGQYSLRELASWINGLTGRDLTHAGLKVAMQYFKSERVRERAIAQAKAEDAEAENEG